MGRPQGSKNKATTSWQKRQSDPVKDAARKKSQLTVMGKPKGLGLMARTLLKVEGEPPSVQVEAMAEFQRSHCGTSGGGRLIAHVRILDRMRKFYACDECGTVTMVETAA